MAIAGGATSAYLCSLDRDGNLITKPTTILRNLCFNPDYAVTEIFNRKLVVVAGSDMVRFRELVANCATKQST